MNKLYKLPSGKIISIDPEFIVCILSENIPNPDCFTINGLDSSKIYQTSAVNKFPVLFQSTVILRNSQTLQFNEDAEVLHRLFFNSDNTGVLLNE